MFSRFLFSRRAAVLPVTFLSLMCAPIVSAFAQLPAPAAGTPAKDEIEVTAPRSTPGASNPGKAPAALPAPSPWPPAAAKVEVEIDGEESPANAATDDGDPGPKPKNQTPKPLSVGGTSIRGMSYVAAIKKLRDAHSDKLLAQVELWDGKRAHRLRRSALGATIPYYKLLAQALAMSQEGGDVPLRFEVNLKQANRAMSVLAGRINHASADTSLDIDAAGKVVLSGGEGTTLSVSGSALRVKDALESDAPQTFVELVVARQASANKLEQFKYLLGEYSTPYDSSIRGRTTNLEMAAKLVNGEIVPAGKVFSTNLAIGPRNAAAGWKEAKMFVGGEVVSGVGAGICQCATTIYNAALLSNLPIVERHQHSFRVNYAPASRDATIYWGQKDMRFRNNTKGPLYVQTLVKDERFHVRIYSVAPLKADVAIESKVLSENKGTRSEAYRIVETGGKQKREFLSRDYYKPKAH